MNTVLLFKLIDTRVQVKYINFYFMKILIRYFFIFSISWNMEEVVFDTMKWRWGLFQIHTYSNIDFVLYLLTLKFFITDCEESENEEESLSDLKFTNRENNEHVDKAFKM